MGTKLYLSGPMTGLPNFNFDAFNLAASQLRSVGYFVENPAEKGIIKGWSWSDYLRYDIGKLIKCYGVATLPGWQLSRGAKLEIYNAVQLEMTCASVSEWLRVADV